MRKVLYLIVCMTTALLFNACGSSGSDGAPGASGTPGVVASASGDCLVCHSNVATTFASGKHMGGSMSRQTLNDGSHEQCIKCHDTVINGLSDSPSLDSMSSQIINAGGAGITCIGCHRNADSSSKHYDKADLQTADCGTCHSGTPSWHAQYASPKIVDNYNQSAHAKDFSSHFTFVDPEKKAIGDNIYVSSCVPCHTGSGFNKYFKEKWNGIAYAPFFSAAFTTENTNSYSFLTGKFRSFTTGATIPYTQVGCSACHDAHGTDLALQNEPATGTINYSAEFRTCTKCHDAPVALGSNVSGMPVAIIDSSKLDDTTQGVGLTDGVISYVGGSDLSGVVITNVATINPNAVGYHLQYRKPSPASAGQPLKQFVSSGRTIMDTHFQGNIVTEVVVFDNVTYIAKREAIAGYNIRPRAEKACTVCHDPHNNSMYGKTTGSLDYTFTNGLPDNGLATRTNQKEIEMATEYANTAKHMTSASSHTGSCVRCHGGDSYPQYAHGQTMTATYDQQKACYTCHELDSLDASGKISGETIKWTRSGGNEFRFAWADNVSNLPVYFDASRDVIDITNAGGQVVCFNCHSGDRTGRETGLPRIAVANATATTLANLNIASVHYPAGLAVVNGTAFYGLSGKTYSWVNPHKNMATSCIDCHEATADGHTFKAITRDGAGNMTSININKENCKMCHASPTDYLIEADEAKTGLRAAVVEIIADINTNYPDAGTGVITYTPPVSLASGSSVAVDATGRNWMSRASGDEQLARDLYGSVLNLNLIVAAHGTGDEGAYAHNKKLIQQLLWDMKAKFSNTGSGVFTSTPAKKFVGNSRPQ